MRTIKTAFVSTVVAWMIAAIAVGPALAQTSPNWSRGYVPTAAEWNKLWASKQDYLGAPPLLTTGGTMIGALITSASTTVRSGLNLPQGSAPTSPNNGDVWTTSAGMYVRIEGVTVGPLGTGGGGGGAVNSVANSDGTLSISPTTGNVVVSLNVTHGNTWSGLQQFVKDGFALQGSSSGVIRFNAPASAGANTITWPAGTTNFSSTGGTSQVVRQSTSGGALTVSQLACSDLSSVAASCATDATNATNIGSGTLAYARLPTVASDNLLGNPTGSTAVPQAVPLVNCANALTYSTSTHAFGCNASAGTGTVTSVVVAAGTGIAVSGTCTITSTGTCTAAFSPDVIARKSNSLTPHEGLFVQQASNSTVSFTATALTLFNTNGDATRLATFSSTVDITASGANGLDTGSEAASTWYALWGIAKDDGTKAGLLSTSFTAPTMPAGYTKKGLISAVYNNASSNLVPYSQNGTVVTQESNIVLAAGTATSFTALSLATAVPPGVFEVNVWANTFTSSSTSTVTGTLAGAGSGTTPTYGEVRIGGLVVGTTGIYGGGTVYLSASQTSVYRINDASSGLGRFQVTVIGYKWN